MKLLPENRGTRIIIGIMIVLTAAGLTIAQVYYGRINRSVDPRVKQARVMYGRYNLYASDDDHEMVLAVLDSINYIYSSVPHYSNSYEKGVIQNNRASVFLARALEDSVREEVRRNYFNLAEHHLVSGIEYYTSWLDTWGSLSESDLMAAVGDEFATDQSLSKDRNLEAIVRKRVSDIITAQNEVNRRLSVSYTNLGVIRRHENRVEEAYEFYNKALDLWEDNLAARNNMNILFGRPPEKQSMIRKLFPPDR